MDDMIAFCGLVFNECGGLLARKCRKAKELKTIQRGVKPMKYHGSKKVFSAVLILVVICAAAIAYADNHEVLTPLLIDQPGWDAQEAEGMSMDMGTMKMITASRTYTQDSKEMDAMLIIGNQAMTQGKMQQMKAESLDTKVSITNIDGFNVQTVYDKNDKSFSVVVFLSQSQTKGAMFMLSGKGLSENEALGIAKKFNWKNMKATVEKLL